MKHTLGLLVVSILIIIPVRSILPENQETTKMRKVIPVTRLRSCDIPCPFAYYTGLDYPLRLVIRDVQQWREMWERIHRRNSEAPPLPEIDFSREVIVLAAMGAKATGGYGIMIDEAHEKNDGVEVLVRSQSPGKSCATTAAVTQPVDIVRIPKSERPISFREVEETRECGRGRKSSVPVS